MTSLTALIAAAAILAVPPGAPALDPEPGRVQNFMAASALERYCSAAENDLQGLADICVGYIAGVVDQVLVHTTARVEGDMNCPETITIGHFRDEFLAYARRFPQDGNVSAAVILEFTSNQLLRCLLRTPGFGAAGPLNREPVPEK